MARLSQQKRLIEELGMFFAEVGRIPKPKEYERMTERPRSATLREINRILGSWNTLIKKMEKEYPDIWTLIHKPAEQKLSPLEQLSAAKVEG